jgi:TonB family protein
LLSRLNLTDLPGGQTGSVLLRLYVNNLGTVDKVEVVVSSGHPELDQTGIEAVKHARFRPAYDGPTPVPGRIEVRLSWGSGSKSYIWENSRGF